MARLLPENESIGGSTVNAYAFLRDVVASCCDISLSRVYLELPRAKGRARSGLMGAGRSSGRHPDI